MYEHIEIIITATILTAIALGLMIYDIKKIEIMVESRLVAEA